jgi:hypothetical protein
MAQRIQIRRDTAANWTSANPTLAQGEIGLETDTGKFKFGDGSTAWTGLSYSVGIALAEWGEITGTLSDQEDLQAELDAKLDAEAIDTNGASITFDIPRTYGNTTSLTGNITIDETGALKGITQLVIHNDSSEPTYGTGAVIVSGTYQNDVDNYIYYDFVKAGIINISIVQRV